MNRRKDVELFGAICAARYRRTLIKPCAFYGKFIAKPFRPAELRASPDPIVQQFIGGKSTGPMETPGF